jgi:RNA polymerase sigma-70 factor (ECF subfamily)
MDQEDRFLSVLEKHKGILYKVATSYCKDSEDRKDLVQEMVYQLWRSFDNYNEQYKYSTWIYRVAINVAISFYRKENSRKVVILPFSKSLLNFSDTPDVEKEIPGLKQLEQYIFELKELDKALILLYLDEKSYREMADIMGITETNVATKISRIKNSLKQKFSKTKY